MEALVGLLALVSNLSSIGSIACLIMVLIKLFKQEGVGLGILGIFCGIYTFIWGWMNVNRHNLKTVMLIWTACFAVSIISVILTIVIAAGSAASS
jgi:hypothetical protein